MSAPVLTFATWYPAPDAWETMRAERVRHAVVLRDEKLCGVISDRDLGGPRGAALRAGRVVGDLMSAGPLVVAAPHMSVEHVARLLREKRIGCVPVVEDDVLVGIATRGDLLRALLQHSSTLPSGT